MKKDPNGGGAEKDGSLNLKYCSYCFAEGAITQPDITVDGMQALVRDQIKGFLQRVYQNWKDGIFPNNLKNIKHYVFSIKY
ncbi:MAG: zinc ribbon domain-containing protein [Bacteroidota bacterium]